MVGQTTTDDEPQQIKVTIAVESVIKALKLNDTSGADDRVIAVPQKDGAEAKIRRAFRGSERYSNPESAPVHIRPGSLVEDAFTRPPRRHHVEVDTLDIPREREDRTKADEQRIDEALEVLIDNWERDVSRMILGEHSFEGKGCEITLVGTED